MTKFKDLKPGEIVSERHFYTVVKTKGNEVQLKNEKGDDIVVDKDYVENCLISAVQYEREEKVTKTDIANILLTNPDVAMEVNFNKQVKEADVVKEITEKVTGSSIKDIEKAIKAGVKKAINGEERIMRGYHSGSVNEFGRLTFVDMEAKDGHPRQVDPRNVNSLIVKGTKYVVK